MISERIGLMMRIALALLVLVAANRTTLGQEVKIVVPNALENVEGDGAGAVPPGVGFRFQSLDLATEFATLPETHRTIVGAFLRPDRDVTEPRTVVWEDSLFRLSTTPKTPANLDPQFDENVGGDVTTVLGGTITVTTEATGPTEGPRGFDYFFEFDTPFVYDPSAGNLLLEVVSFSGYVPSLQEDFDSSGVSIFSPDPSSDTGSRFSGQVHQWVLFPNLYTGDYNGDDELTVADIDLLSAELREDAPSKWFDLNRDGVTGPEDHRVWVKQLKHTWIGDADLNGEFNSSDMVQVFAAGKYETGQEASWDEGNWDTDPIGEFNSSDMVAAFADGGYEKGPQPPTVAVPEPTSVLLLVMSLIGLAIFGRSLGS